MSRSEPTDDVAADGDGNPPPSSELFNPATTVRVIVMQNVVPVLATVGSYLAFVLIGPV